MCLTLSFAQYENEFYITRQCFTLICCIQSTASLGLPDFTMRLPTFKHREYTWPESQSNSPFSSLMGGMLLTSSQLSRSSLCKR